ncbi:ATP-binding protein [Candidatus Viridilinea mediisalina]|nr:ATP-binding protein [Candidatus Viridilinea mediisalina]
MATVSHALHRWRMQALNVILGILIIIPMPMIIIDALGQFWYGSYLLPSLKLVSYTAVALLVFNQKLDYQLRVVLLLANSLFVITYMLISDGETSVGRGYLIATVAIAALMLNRWATLLVWLSGAAALFIGMFVSLQRSEVELATLMLRMHDPMIMLNGVASTLIMSAITAVGALSLVQRINASLQAVELAQAERDQANLMLEQRVAERTQALEQTLAALQASEAQHEQVVQSLAGREAHLRALRDALPDLLFIVDVQGVFRGYHAPEHTELWMPPEEFLGRPVDQVLPPELAEMTLITLHQVRDSGQIRQFEFAMEHARDGRIFQEVRVAQITADEFLILVRDITERRLAVQQLLRAKESAEAADRAKSLFLAQMSHEIRTPLTAIVAASQLIQSTALTPRQGEYVQTMHTSAELLRHVIGNILDFSKIEAGQIDLHIQPFDLHACLNDALGLVAHAAQQRAIGFTQVVEQEVPRMLMGDSMRLRQILVNLLGNAVKFTRHGSVTLRVGGQPCPPNHFELMLRVEDTGIGIAPEQLALIFEPFARGEAAITRHVDGSGLGLTISKQLVALMGGSLTVTSEVGVGSTFTLRLSLEQGGVDAEQRTGEQENREQENREQGGVEPGSEQREALRILLAEDNPINQRILRYMIEHLGYQVDLANHGAEAVAIVARQPYDLVFMDIQMPFLDGEAATRQIRALEGITQPYIVALTASALGGDRERYLEAGMDAYLSKPVQPEALQAIFAHCVGRQAQQTAPQLPSSALAAEESLVDWRTLDSLIETMGPAPAYGARLITDLFCGPFASQLAELEDALAADDRERMRMLAHKLRGASLQLGANPLANHWARLELALRRGEDNLETLLEAARQTYTTTLAQLEAHLQQFSEEG